MSVYIFDLDSGAQCFGAVILENNAGEVIDEYSLNFAHEELHDGSCSGVLPGKGLLARHGSSLMCEPPAFLDYGSSCCRSHFSIDAVFAGWFCF